MNTMQDQTAPAPQDSNEAPVGHLVQRLLKEHRRWRTRDFPTIEHLFDEAQGAESTVQPPCLAPLRKAFFRLCAELEGHMNREETILFPAILQAQTGPETPSPGFGSIRNPIAMVEQEHDWETERLEKIRQLAQNYQLPENAPEKVRLLFRELEALEASMHAHTALESSILFARALSRERTGAPAKSQA